MQLHKTERARAALAERSFGLSAFERRILILSDGRRTVDALSSLLGAEARTGVERLVAGGYLRVTPTAGAESGGVLHHEGEIRGAARRLFAAIGPSRHAPSGDAAPAQDTAGSAGVRTQTQAASVPAPPPVPRRSLAASKMYVLDMLQLQRGAGAASLRGAIQGSGDPLQLTAALLEALAFLQRNTPPSYSRRVLDRIAEILPEEALPLLRTQCEAIASAP